MECRQSTPYMLDTASSKPNILHASKVDIPRDAVQIGVTGRQGQGIGQMSTGSRSRSKGEKWSTSGPRCGGPRPRQLLITTFGHNHKRPRLAARAGMAKAAAKLWSASPTAVPEDFANMAYRFIQDWAATQPQCPRPGFPIKRRRSLPRASPREHNPARPGACLLVGTWVPWVVSTWHADNHSNSMACRNNGRPRRAAAPESGRRASISTRAYTAPRTPRDQT